MQRKEFAISLLFPFTALLIAVFSLIPRPPESLLPWDFADKAGHFLAYFSLAALGMVFFGNRLKTKPIRFTVNIILCVFWGGLIELVQPFTGRTADIVDFLVNAIAVLLASLLLLFLPYFRKFIKHQIYK